MNSAISKRVLLISIFINIAFVIFFIGKRIYYSYGFAKENIDWLTIAEEKNKAMTAQFASFRIDSNDVVFVGNSLTEGFPVTEYFQHAKNRGIGGNTIEYVIGRVGQITLGKPKQIFIEVGINDINTNIAMDTIKGRYCSLINIIRTQSPSTEIFIQSLIPTSKEYKWINEQIIELNNYLITLSRSTGATYVNIHSLFLKGDKLNDDYTTDGLHLNNNGYKIWAEAIRQFVYSK